ncbi:hypothetical protein D3C79_1039880 [compost metagenome]
MGGPPTRTGRPTGIGSVTAVGRESSLRSVWVAFLSPDGVPTNQQLTEGRARKLNGSPFTATVLLPIKASASHDGGFCA